MSGAELSRLRPHAEELRAISDQLGANLASLEHRVEEGIATVEKEGIQLRGLAVEVGGMIHQLNSLKCSILVMLDELDRLAPVPAPSAPTGPTKGRA